MCLSFDYSLGSKTIWNIFFKISTFVIFVTVRRFFTISKWYFQIFIEELGVSGAKWQWLYRWCRHVLHQWYWLSPSSVPSASPDCSHVMVWHGSSVPSRAPGLRWWLVMSSHFYAFHLHLGLSVKVKRWNKHHITPIRARIRNLNRSLLHYLYMGMEGIVFWGLGFRWRLVGVRAVRQRRHRRQQLLTVQVLLQ